MRSKSYVHPASHAGGPSASAPAPIYGTRLRLKANTDTSALNTAAKVVANALKKYGMLLADGGTIALTAQNDRYTTHTWNGVGLGSLDLSSIPVTAFEVVAWSGNVQTLTYDCARNNVSVADTCDGGAVSTPDPTTPSDGASTPSVVIAALAGMLLALQ
eukprot:TRINITY_DN1236_c0_g1_i3.p3 TRINITY_DN1236_c0_g1~~TRINITY_DN1236_c0_g1_i3.p3  ORF type:complete len:159 (+),score=37.41 TRINITY_DN1236_c0_g1_i3:593-1069(+)